VPRPSDAGPGGPAEPPADPEAWTDEEWLAWLRATDGAGFGGGDGDEAGTGTRMTTFTRRPGAKALGAAMIGLRNAMYGVSEDEVVVVADAGGDPPNDDPHDVPSTPTTRSAPRWSCARRGPPPTPTPMPAAAEWATRASSAAQGVLEFKFGRNCALR
jgi:hypothetical protein